jgi:electron transfer flavoprotein alpha subunit
MNEVVGPVWVLAEKNARGVESVSLELISHGRNLAEKLDVDLEALFLGFDLHDDVNDLFAAGADRVFVGDDPGLENYQPEIYTSMLTSLARQRKPSIFLIGSTWIGVELAPLIAASLGTGLTAHCTDLLIDDEGNLDHRVPAYGGLLSIKCPHKRPQMATAAAGVFSKVEYEIKRSAEIVKLDIPVLHAQKVETLEIVLEKFEGVELESAPIIVAGGAGAGDIDGWQQIVGLAEMLNAALGSTRPAVDEGWTALDTMIGQSGKMVNPDIYIGIGLSGEQQHMVGITGAKVMIAINNDPDAPVFEQVDFGVVDDCREFIPILIEKIEAHLATAMVH